MDDWTPPAVPMRYGDHHLTLPQPFAAVDFAKHPHMADHRAALAHFLNQRFRNEARRFLKLLLENDEALATDVVEAKLWEHLARWCPGPVERGPRRGDVVERRMLAIARARFIDHVTRVLGHDPSAYDIRANARIYVDRHRDELRARAEAELASEGEAIEELGFTPIAREA